MKLVTFRRPGAAFSQVGAVEGAEVKVLASYTDMIAALGVGIDRLQRSAAVAASVPLSSVELLAPIARPSKLICIGLNYRDHAIESNMAMPKTPTVFCKFTTSIIGPGASVVLPKISTQPDYEAEFAFVIGKGGRYIAADNWRDHVIGYTIVNDVSARDIQLATSQWIMGKTFDTFAPMGPYITTADEIADPHNLNISLTLNGETLQNSNTRELIFKIPELIEHLSSVFTFETGDIVSTGTPAGVGFARKPPVLLKPGDDMITRVEGLGELRNPVVGEP
jgi:2-keto-4-pentenoate hydratase/2-oxohepta-3-ene-1,7-dioic acid hydratase in catechol pathway